MLYVTRSAQLRFVAEGLNTSTCTEVRKPILVKGGAMFTVGKWLLTAEYPSHQINRFVRVSG